MNAHDEDLKENKPKESLSVPGTASYYDELKALVRSHEQQTTALARCRAESAQKVAESAAQLEQMRSERDALRAEHGPLHVELGKLRERQARERRTAAKAETELREEMAEAIEVAAQQEAARSREELSLLRSAARADVEDAVGALQTRHAVEAERWAAQLGAMREAAKLTSGKHALRLRQVIEAEEAERAEHEAAEEQLESVALCCLSLGVRLRGAERLVAEQGDEMRGLAWERAREAKAAAAAEEARLALLEESALAADAAEEVVGRLRAEVRAVAKKQRSWRDSMAAKHEQELSARVAEAVRDEGIRVHATVRAAAEERESQAYSDHAAEVGSLRRQLEAARAQLGELEAALVLQRDLIGEL